jgi:hypothetical protein
MLYRLSFNRTHMKVFSESVPALGDLTAKVALEKDDRPRKEDCQQRKQNKCQRYVKGRVDSIHAHRVDAFRRHYQ